MKEYYRTDPNDPDAPVRLEKWCELKVGDSVKYVGPIPLPGPLVISAIYDWGTTYNGDLWVEAILNDGEYECSALNLRKVPLE